MPMDSGKDAVSCTGAFVHAPIIFAAFSTEAERESNAS